MAVEEQVELEESRKAEILALDAKVTSSNLFDFLGVPAGSGPEEVRAAFRDASRKFHPDRYFGKNLGSFREKLDRIFRHLVEANQTLTDPEKRAAYLASNPFVRAAVRASAGSGEFKLEVPQTKTEVEEARDAERRTRLARHPYLAKATKVQEYLNRAKNHFAMKEFSQAVTYLNNAAQIDPTQAEVKAMLVEARKGAELVRSETSYLHAIEALNRGDESLALQALKVAVSANPLNHQAAHKAALLLGKGRDGKAATSFAQKAVDAAPKNVEYRMHLAELLMEAGMKAMAKKHFEEAARLEPSHPLVKKHGKKLWPF